MSTLQVTHAHMRSTNHSKNSHLKSSCRNQNQKPSTPVTVTAILQNLCHVHVWVPLCKQRCSTWFVTAHSIWRTPFAMSHSMHSTCAASMTKPLKPACTHKPYCPSCDPVTQTLFFSRQNNTNLLVQNSAQHKPKFFAKTAHNLPGFTKWHIKKSRMHLKYCFLFPSFKHITKGGCVFLCFLLHVSTWGWWLLCGWEIHWWTSTELRGHRRHTSTKVWWWELTTHHWRWCKWTTHHWWWWERHSLHWRSHESMRRRWDIHPHGRWWYDPHGRSSELRRHEIRCRCAKIWKRGTETVHRGRGERCRDGDTACCSLGDAERLEALLLQRLQARILSWWGSLNIHAHDALSSQDNEAQCALLLLLFALLPLGDNLAKLFAISQDQIHVFIKGHEFSNKLAAIVQCHPHAVIYELIQFARFGHTLCVEKKMIKMIIGIRKWRLKCVCKKMMIKIWCLQKNDDEDLVFVKTKKIIGVRKMKMLFGVCKKWW